MIYRFQDEGESDLRLEVNRVGPGSVYFEIVRSGESGSDIVSLDLDTVAELQETLTRICEGWGVDP